MTENLCGILDQIFSELCEYDKENIKQVDAPSSYLNDLLAGNEWVLFCGAGISIDGRSNAPGFLEIRDSVLKALTVNLVNRDVLTKKDGSILLDSINNFNAKKGLEFPPEQLFTYIKDHIGLQAVTEILGCLNEGEPNDNHYAIAELCNNKKSGLNRIVTTNFDLYIEKAFSDSHVSLLTNRGLRSSKSSYLPQESNELHKIHGSLDSSESIVITLTQVALRSRYEYLLYLRPIIENKTVVVSGYSGLDFDISPILVHAGRVWNTRFIWLLWNQDALNSNIFKLKVALKDKCELIDTKETPLLQEIAGVRSIEPNVSRADLVSIFSSVFCQYGTLSLIKAFIAVMAPIDVQNIGHLKEKLCCRFLNEIKIYEYKDKTNRLKDCFLLTQQSKGTQSNISILNYCKSVAASLNERKWTNYFETQNKQAGETIKEYQLRIIDYNLKNNFHQEIIDSLGLDVKGQEDRFIVSNYMTKIHLLPYTYRVSEILQDTYRYSKAANLAKYVLDKYQFPDFIVNDEEDTFNEPKTKATLYYTIAVENLERNDIQGAADYLYKAIKLLWDNQDHYYLIGYLSLARRFGNEKLSGLVQSIMLMLSKFSGNVREELLLILKWKICLDENNDYLKRAKAIRLENSFSAEDERMFDELMNNAHI